ncbi:MAG: hypothetical protein JJ901_03020 [Erythrobacter sp.]|uniref:hypothetical protein n=1 Tax=Erythrobacter sp. TaxID=1042 RepID=UPI001B2DBD10|nr:hypothetical protein [Erythrobacter sp.]MBO6767261.1 hypothetical protein [Erythrobacter sp.]
MAIEEMDALLDTLSKQATSTVGDPALSVEQSSTLLQKYRSRVSETAKSVSNDAVGFSELADEAHAMEIDVAQIAEAVWGIDEARVSGLLFAWGVLKTHDGS